MTPKEASRKRAAATEEYENDGGFVEDAPKSKKSKQTKNSTVVSGKQEDDEGNEYWELSRTRRIQLSEFKGTTMVNIREFYEKDDKMLPGKKGISLSVDQFKGVIEALPEIEASLRSKKIELPRPDYGGVGATASSDAQDDVDVKEDENEEEEIPEASSKSKLDKFKFGKGNHEATSDEGEEK